MNELVFCRKYYVDIKRREDGFDLSGPYHPPQDPVRLRAVSNNIQNIILLYTF